MSVHAASRTAHWAAYGVPVAVLLVVALVEVLLILSLNGGHFTYSIDDPYIHLALARNIRAGHYGINACEVSAPASSILWPLLLTPFAQWTQGGWAPLVINVLAAAATLIVGIRLVLLLTCGRPPRRQTASAILIGIVLIVVWNLIGLAFTGMEHSVQVLLAVLVAAGLIWRQETRCTPGWFWVAVVAGPLIRYENLAVSLPALLVMFLWGERAKAVWSAVGLAAALLAFSAFLWTNGLAVLPTSVLEKSRVVSGAGRLAPILVNVRKNLFEHGGRGVALVIAALLCGIRLNARSPAGERLIAAWAVALVGLHLLVGNLGWFSRYEVYAWAASLLAVLYLYRHPVEQWLARTAPLKATLSVLAASAVVCPTYWLRLVQTPQAANNIYQQHYQMHRFAADYYRQPVAANDIGYLSYGNTNYVLDLVGLASREALTCRRTCRDPEWMNVLARRYGVKLAMIYDAFFPSVPTNWVRLGELKMDGRKLTAVYDTVDFYSLDPSGCDAAIGALRDFQQQLPDGVRFEFASGFNVNTGQSETPPQ